MRGNFDYLDNPTVVEVIEQAARRLARRYANYTEYDDLLQEAYILVATKDDLQSVIETEDYGYLQHRLERDLIDLLDTVVRRASKNTSYEALVEAGAEL